MNRSLLACVATVWMACAPAQAQVYKCKDAGGRTVMQQTPCAGGAGQKLDVRPASGHQSGGGAARVASADIPAGCLNRRKDRVGACVTAVAQPVRARPGSRTR